MKLFEQIDRMGHKMMDSVVMCGGDGYMVVNWRRDSQNNYRESPICKTLQEAIENYGKNDGVSPLEWNRRASLGWKHRGKLQEQIETAFEIGEVVRIYNRTTRRYSDKGVIVSSPFTTYNFIDYMFNDRDSVPNYGVYPIYQVRKLNGKIINVLHQLLMPELSN